MTKVLGIIGASYSGTTTMTMLLGGREGWFPAGETHWLKDTPFEKFYCPECRGSCVEWTDALRADLKSTSNWWDTMRSSLSHHEWLVSSDKIPKFFDANPGVDNYLLQWKDPRSWLYSARKHEGITVDQAINSWSALYEQAIDFLAKGKPVISVDWDKFSRQPLAQLNRILLRLGEAPATAMPQRNSAHMIGGNSEARGLNRSADYLEAFAESIREDVRWKSGNTPADNDRMLSSPRVKSVMEKLSAIVDSK